MTEHEAEMRALRAERDELEIENRALRESNRRLESKLQAKVEELWRLRREVFGSRGLAAEASS